MARTGSERVGPKHHRGTAMEHYAGIDVSLERSSVCVVDAMGRIVREAKVASEPGALVRFFQALGLPLTRLGLEAGPLSQWLHAGLTAAGFEVVLLETRHVKAALAAMVVKTDRKDARGIATLHRAMLAIVRADAVCRRLMTVPGVGALVAVTFTAAVDDPQRFATSKAVGAHFGLTPKKYQSGETDVTGAISKVGDAMVRTALYEAAHILLTRAVRFSSLKRWAMAVAQRRGMKRAKVALARKLAVVLHAMWRDGTAFRWGKEP